MGRFRPHPYPFFMRNGHESVHRERQHECPSEPVRIPCRTPPRTRQRSGGHGRARGSQSTHLQRSNHRTHPRHTRARSACPSRRCKRASHKDERHVAKLHVRDHKLREHVEPEDAELAGGARESTIAKAYSACSTWRASQGTVAPSPLIRLAMSPTSEPATTHGGSERPSPPLASDRGALARHRGR